MWNCETRVIIEKQLKLTEEAAQKIKKTIQSPKKSKIKKYFSKRLVRIEQQS